MRSRTVWTIGVATLVVGLAVGAYALWSQREQPIHADSADLRLVGIGRDVYARQCASCHGAGLEGQPEWQTPLATGGRPAPPHDPSGHTWHHPDRILFDLTKFGGQPYSPADYQSNMPAFGGILTDREIVAVLAYIKSTWPREIQARQERVNQSVADR